ncbi:MAG: hypothetical protein Q4G46_04080 [Propionibacteriaceae bacterium]|nr:hypothetical protein [Propionibacteriaceae bacterium]
MTSEVRETFRPPWTRRFAGRPRIVGWITAVTALGLLLLILAVSVALRATVRAGIQEGITQEAGEIQQFSATGVDPTTGERFESTLRFIEVYLARQHPESSELLLGGLPAAAPTTEVRGADAVSFADLDSAARGRLLEPGGAGTLTTRDDGVISWRTVDLTTPTASTTQGYITIVVFHQPQEARTRTSLAMLVLIALGALAATGAVSWVVAGRILSHVDQFEAAADRAARQAHLSRLSEEGPEEYARLARAANLTLATAEEAAERNQRFVDDLTHELRTPLAIVRGSLEQPGGTSATVRVEIPSD